MLNLFSDISPDDKNKLEKTLPETFNNPDLRKSRNEIILDNVLGHVHGHTRLPEKIPEVTGLVFANNELVGYTIPFIEGESMFMGDLPEKVKQHIMEIEEEQGKFYIDTNDYSKNAIQKPDGDIVFIDVSAWMNNPENKAVVLQFNQTNLDLPQS